MSKPPQVRNQPTSSFKPDPAAVAEATKQLGNQAQPERTTGKVFGEHQPPAVRKVVECRRCFFGADVSRGYRVCRGSTPGTLYRNVDGSGVTHADGLWPKVLDSDWCARGEPL